MPSHAEPDQPPDLLAPWKRWVCHVGYASEGVVYLLVGFFSLLAAIGQHREPNGSKGALAGLGATPLGKTLLLLLALGLTAFVLWEFLVAFSDRGRWLLGIVAAGLISYGLFQISKERYRRMGPADNAPT